MVNVVCQMKKVRIVVQDTEAERKLKRQPDVESTLVSDEPWCEAVLRTLRAHFWTPVRYNYYTTPAPLLVLDSSCHLGRRS